MNINVKLNNRFLPDEYTLHGDINDKKQDMPIKSFPIEISNVPPKTKSLSLILLDDDSIPVCGFTYIHWVMANIDPTTKLIPEDQSQKEKIPATKGKNSLAGKLVNITDKSLNEHYLGPKPPSGTHDYQLEIIALDKKLNLNDGFWLNEMKHQMKDHIIESAKLTLPTKH
ncbi:YbhB/YbcL family Raf kinase inhibitor-like protein [Lactobacillus sp. S2-2]|uniref:YbhB/YbcL family Raf kinase inhibitor-like protein n=1 Tax=Lactobacillus sp. S2-2 TaxID=2692917 RepID=UPI001F42F156|nr:YbhB/YbcL family Raf kinase inhibitor-like protein [Lactobacillus sp. S2-2]MCF6514719.1 YbhB/YbcL family Raf kinase inhibitor-like protein [Lactobacillus sp. S2-2]